MPVKLHIIRVLEKLHAIKAPEKLHASVYGSYMPVE